MRNYLLVVLIGTVSFAACLTRHASRQEAALLPGTESGKWWIINTILQDSYGKDVHFNSLISIDKTGRKNYTACFVSAWSERDSTYYAATRISQDTGIKYRNNFPVRISFPAVDSSGIEWSLLFKRNTIQLLSSFSNKKTNKAGGYTELVSVFRKQDPFAVSVISSLPQAWAVNPIIATSKMKGDLYAAGKDEKLCIRVFANKEVLLKKSSGAYVHWLDLSLQSGKQLGVLFTTDANGGITTDAVLLWDEQGEIMAKPPLFLQQLYIDSVPAASLSRPYPLYFSVVIPSEQINLKLQPRMAGQEITANRSSCWMGAVEATDSSSGRRAGKGNMYIFKQ